MDVGGVDVGDETLTAEGDARRLAANSNHEIRLVDAGAYPSQGLALHRAASGSRRCSLPSTVPESPVADARYEQKKTYLTAERASGLKNPASDRTGQKESRPR